MRKALFILAVATALLAAVLALSTQGSVDASDTVSEATEASSPEGHARAIFAGGCFWCMEPPFDKLEGVLSTTSGYTGGSEKDPTYEQVSYGRTSHAEAVEIVYDPSKISYERLLHVFWRNIDPTVTNRQFCDTGSQYRTGSTSRTKKSSVSPRKPSKPSWTPASSTGS